LTIIDDWIGLDWIYLLKCVCLLPIEVLSAQLGRKPEDIVKLDANENPYGPPPEASLYLSFTHS